MPEDSEIQEFPDISNKLTAPTKKSLFERQKAEAEAKRLREKAETAAVYEDFVKSFDDEVDSSSASGGRQSSNLAGFSRQQQFGAFPTGPARSSGPGSLGPPPPSLSRKRPYEGSQPIKRETASSLFAFENSAQTPLDAVKAFHNSDDDEEAHAGKKGGEKWTAKPTLQLSSLPPGTSPAVIKALLPDSLTIDNIKILPPPPSGTGERRSFSSIVTLASETPANLIDGAVNSLQNRYLGWGFYLSLNRHLSSAALSVGAPTASTSIASTMPFAARPVSGPPGGSLNRAPPPSAHRGGFAPPASYDGVGQFGRATGPLRVHVEAPSDLKQLKLIHKTVENLLTYGPEFEALLMSRVAVQRHERWAWLWNPRSLGGVYYRWRLWQLVTKARETKGVANSHTVFRGGAEWQEANKGPAFEFVTKLEEFVSDDEYNSSDEEDSDNENRPDRHNLGAGSLTGLAKDGTVGDSAYLNPLQRAKLTHLLARLPTTSAKLRRGDIARVTGFAIEHAGEGSEEVVEMIVTNIHNPYAYTNANPDRDALQQDEAIKMENPDGEEQGKGKQLIDTSSAKIVALHCVSDILSSSSTSGVRHAWRYRALFENSLKARKTFEHLGRLEKEMRWGRLRVEKWRRSVSNTLCLWEGWCVFPQVSQDHFVEVFNDPPLTSAEKEAAVAAERTENIATNAAKSKWKAVDENASEEQRLDAQERHQMPDDAMDVDGMQMAEDGLDGQSLDDVDGDPMEDVDGEPMEDSMDEEDDQDVREPSTAGESSTTQNVADLSNRDDQGRQAEVSQPAKKRRPRAEDMFADSDDDQ